MNKSLSEGSRGPFGQTPDPRNTDRQGGPLWWVPGKNGKGGHWAARGSSEPMRLPHFLPGLVKFC